MFTGLLQKKVLRGAYEYPDGREAQGRVLGRGPRGGAMPLVNTPLSRHLCVSASSAGPSLGTPYGAFLTWAWPTARCLSLQPLSRAWGWAQSSGFPVRSSWWPSPGRPSGVTLSEQNSFLSPMQFQGIYELTVMTWVKGQILEPKMLLVFLSLEKLQGFKELWAWRWGRANIYIFSIIS